MNELIPGRDYEVVDDGMSSISDNGLADLKSYLERSSKNAVSKFANYLNQATSGSKGRYVTYALRLTDLPMDGDKLQAVYDQHPDIINAYFEQIDVREIARLTKLDDTVSKSAPKAIMKGAGILAVGAVIGVAGLTLFNRK